MTLSLLSVIGIIIFVALLGILNYWISASPIIDSTHKAIIKWIIVGVAIIAVAYFILSLFGYGNLMASR